jgi:ketosteroid isomerase-like protein
MHPFRAAIEARDLDAVTSLLADDVVFRSPIVFRPDRGQSPTRNPGGGLSRV